MKDRDKLIIAIIAVIMIIVLVVGSTFAYWTWATNASQKTNVNFTIANNTSALGLAATLEGNGTTTAVNLKPTSCTDATYAIKKTVTITSTNETNQAAAVTATLSATAFTLRSASYQPTSANLTNLKWAITTNASSCTSSTVTNGTGSFTGITFTGTSANNLPKTLGTVTFAVPANTTSTNPLVKTYYLWIWLDSAYTHTNYGDVNDDPMQGFTVTTQWSGEINNT